MDMFWTNGYTATSPAQLAEATGVGKGSLYHAFGSKRELFDRALTRYEARAVEVTDEFFTQPGTARECLSAFLRYLADRDLMREYPRGCLVVTAIVEQDGHDAEMIGRLRRIQQDMITRIAERIEKGRRDGDVRADLDSLTAAEFILNTLYGVRVLSKTADTALVHRIIDTALTVL